MSGINKAIVVGNLGQDPEMRYMPDGAAVTTLSIATSDKFKDKQGQAQKRTEWHRVVLFGRIAEIAAEYAKKGSKVYIEGKMKTRKWQDQQGITRYTTEVVVSGCGQFQMLSSSQVGCAQNQGAPVNQGYQSQQERAQSQQSHQQRQESPQPDFDELDDDVPF